MAAFFNKKNLPIKNDETEDIKDYEVLNPEKGGNLTGKDNCEKSDSDKYNLQNRYIDTYQQMMEVNRQMHLADVEEALQYRDMYLGKLDAIRDIGGMVTDIVKSGLDVWKTSKIIERDIRALEVKSNIELSKIAAKYDICQSALMGIFGERKDALKKHYEIMDQALKANDRDLVIASLKGVSDIVTTRPLEDFNKFMDAWNDTNNEEPLELGF